MGAPPPVQVIAHTNLYWAYHKAPRRDGWDGRDQGRRLRRHVLTPLRRGGTLGIPPGGRREAMDVAWPPAHP